MRISLFFRSVRYALRGAHSLWRSEQNIRIQVCIGILVIVAAFFFPLEVWKRVILLLLVGMILILEAINSVFERIMDIVKPRLHPSVQDMKDMMAAAVLFASLSAVGIGTLLLLPYLTHWLREF